MKLRFVNISLVLGYTVFLLTYLSGCQSGTDRSGENADTEINQTPSLPEANQPAADTIQLEAKDLVYLPPDIHLQAGQNVIFKIQNNGEEYHSMVLVFAQDSIKLGDSIPPGETQIMRVQVPANAGKYEFYCPLQNHKSSGMRGEIIVEAAGGN